MLEEAIEKIVNLSRDSEIIDLHGRKYLKTSYNITLIPEPLPREPEEIVKIDLSTLSGLRDYIVSLRKTDGFKDLPLMVHVRGPRVVDLHSSLLHPWNRSHYFAMAEAKVPEFRFGKPHHLENFIVALQANFVGSETVSALLKVVGNLKDGAVRTNADDGYTQSVNVATGITTVDQVDLPNPVTLQPYRTFLEIEQPESQYVFRMERNQGEMITATLHTAEGGMWQMRAMANIKSWLESELRAVKDLTIIA